MEIIYLPSFLRQYKRLPHTLQQEVCEKVELFKDPAYHKQLRVQKLKGALRGRYSFSVNYKIRVVFTHISKTDAALLAIGDHDVYNA